MTSFTYRAVTPQGQQRSGKLDADDRGGAIRAIEALGLVPVDVAPATGGGGAAKAAAAPTSGGRSFGLNRSSRVGRAQVLAFVRQLANLTAAGVPLARALQILSRESSHAAAGRQWAQIRDAVSDGASLADAMAQCSASFAPIHIAMVRAGETGGFLDVVLKQIADFIARERELKGKVLSALVYPIVLAVIALGVVIFLLAWFIPRFSAIFAEFGQSLPLLTRIIQGASDAVRSYGPFVAVGVLIVVLAIRHALQTERGRRLTDQYMLRVPAVGPVMARFALVRFCHMLGTLIGAGVPLIQSLRVARRAVGNQTLSDTLTQSIEDVQQGTSLAKSLARCPQLFGPSVLEMVAVAEESGRLSEELVRMAKEFEADLDRRLRVLVSLAEPALLLVMASMIGMIVIGMLLPVFDLWDAIQ